MKLSAASLRARRSGFSLVEIMVGLAIGMLAAVVILQVFAVSEERKRVTTAGGDAQSNGTITFYQLQRDIEQAGYGISTTSLFNCNLTWQLSSGTSIATPVPLAPVTINPSNTVIPDGDANTDRLLVVYGNTNGQPQGNPLNSASGTVYKPQMPNAFAVGDRVIVAPASCSSNLLLDTVTDVTATTVTTGTASTGSTLYNLGPAPSILAYAIRGGKLTVCDYLLNDCGLDANKTNASIWVPVADNIVSLRALYARDAKPTMNGVPDTYDQTTPSGGCGWARVSAINVALVSRNSQMDKQVVTNTAANAPAHVNAPTWAGEATAPIVGSNGALGPDAAADEPWKHFRYKLFQGIVPIRNVAWMGVPTGC